MVSGYLKQSVTHIGSVANALRADRKATSEPARSGDEVWRAFQYTLLRILCAVALLTFGGTLTFADDAQETGTISASDHESQTSNTFSYDGEAIADVHGGASRDQTYVGSLQYRGTYDLETMLGWSDTLLSLKAVWVHGGQPDHIVGNAQSTVSFAAPAGATVQELWLQKNMLSDSTSILLGLYDLNTEFYRTDTATLFLNSSFGMGPEFAQSGLGGPSIYPRTSVGARFAESLSPHTLVRLAVMNGAPCRRSDGSFAAFRAGDGLLIVAEAAYVSRDDDEDSDSDPAPIARSNEPADHDTKFALGAWHYTTALQRLQSMDGSFSKNGTSGVYGLAERKLFDETGTAFLSGFVQAGVAQPSVNRFGRYIGVGLVQSGILNRPDDQLGLAVGIAANGSAYAQLHRRDPQTTQRETMVELTYSIPASKWLSIQPDLQYVIRPNTDTSMRNAIVAGVHITATLP